MASYTGTTGDDIFTGGIENDTASGGGGADSLTGADGSDTLAGNAGSDTLNGGAGDDTLYSADVSPAYRMPYGTNPYVLPEADTGAERDTLIGGDGSDRIFAGYGDFVDGGADGYQGDYLFISFQAAPQGVTADFGLVTQTIGDGVITGVENLSYVQGSQYGDNINLRSTGYGYSDFTAASGMDGNDTLTAGYYTGTLFGDAGDDLLDGRPSWYLDSIDGGAGNDTIYARNSSFTAVNGGSGDDAIYAAGIVHGGLGSDLIVMQSNYSNYPTWGDEGDDTITASSSGNKIAGGAGADVLRGDAGADTLTSADLDVTTQQPLADLGGEHDNLTGGAGDDALLIGYGDDADGGAGMDSLRLSLAGAPQGLTFSTAGIVSGAATTVGGGTIQNVETLLSLRGTEFADNLDLATQSSLLTVDAGAGDDVITSHNSSVSVTGGAGNDRFVSGAAGDTFDGGAGTDTVDYSGAGAGVNVNLATGVGGGGDRLYGVDIAVGSAFADTLSGDGVFNVLQGGAGADRLEAGPYDTLTGGGDADTFVVTSGASRAHVTDFQVGVDRLDLSAQLQQAGYNGSDPIRDGFVRPISDGAGGTAIYFDPDVYGPNQATPLITLDGVSPSGLTWAQLQGGSVTGQSSTLAFRDAEIGAAEGNTGVRSLTWTVIREGDTSGTATAHWAISGTGPNPADAADFATGTLPSGDVSFAAGETSKTLFVNIVGDTQVEPTEDFQITLSNVQGAAKGNAYILGHIVNDDTASSGGGTTGGQVYTAPGVRSTMTGTSGADTFNGSEAGDTITGGAGGDLFHFAKKPWEPSHITDFQVGSDKLDLSDLLKAVGYTGSDPIADKYISFADNGAGGTKVLFDRDGAATGQQWPDRILELDNLAYNPANASQMLGTSVGGGASGGGSTPPVIAFPIAASGASEGNSGATAFSWTVTRSGDASGTSTVHWAVSGSGGNPVDGADFVGGALPSGDLTFAPGETSKTVLVNAQGDTTVEPNEQFTVTLSNPGGATLGNATVQGQITNDDTAPSGGGTSGQVYTASNVRSTMSGTAYNDTFNASQAADTITGGAGADLFHFASKPWEPAHITDFQLGSDKLDLSDLLKAVGYTGSDPIADKYIQFADNGAGGTKVLFDRDGAATGQQWPDRIIELDNLAYNPANASQMLGSSVGGASGGGSTSTVIALESKTTTQAEGNSGLSIYSYTLTRTGDLSHSSSVGWSVNGSGANPATAADFENGALPSGNFIFAAGESSKTIFVKVAGDTAVESDEQFTVTLSGPNGASLANATALGVIANDDTAPSSGGSAGQVYTSPGTYTVATGTAGNDTFNASQGGDTLTGGAGSDVFNLPSEPWAPVHITDFTPGVDKIDLSHLFDAVGYAGTDPVADHYIYVVSDGAGGSIIRFDRDGGGPNPQWPNTIIDLEHVAPAQVMSSDWIVQ